MRKILILGATSKIAHATAKFFAAQGDLLFLVGRNAEKISLVAGDLKNHGGRITGSLILDLSDISKHAGILDSAIREMAGLDIVFIAHGTLPNQSECEKDYKLQEKVFLDNFLSVVSLTTLAANYMQDRKQGVIAVISSVAGDRARKSNYVYGTSKAALTAYLQGLRNRLFSHGVAVLTIKPGIVDTPMARHLKKNFLFADAKSVGKGIYRAIVSRKDVVYLPGFWILIMGFIRLIPERLFKRLSL